MRRARMQIFESRDHEVGCAFDSGVAGYLDDCWLSDMIRKPSLGTCNQLYRLLLVINNPISESHLGGSAIHTLCWSKSDPFHSWRITRSTFATSWRAQTGWATSLCRKQMAGDGQNCRHGLALQIYDLLFTRVSKNAKHSFNVAA